MICIFFEGRRYLPQLDQCLSGKLAEEICETPFGSGTVLVIRKDGVLCIPDAGMCFGKDPAKFPRAVMHALTQYGVRQMCMISKGGGINKLMHVGDIVISDDYYDNTSIYAKSFRYDTSELPPRYDMLEPFSMRWRSGILSCLKQHRAEHPFNLFDRGVYVCTDGPAFESKAEIAYYEKMNWDVVGHYLSPYIYYAREMKIALACISVVSNSFANADAFLQEDAQTAGLFRLMIFAALESKRDDDCEEQTAHWIKNL